LPETLVSQDAGVAAALGLAVAPPGEVDGRTVGLVAPVGWASPP
jgi:hypothetical protein